MRRRRQVGRSWRRSKRQSAFYLQGSPTTHIAGRADTHPDALPPGPEGASPSRPCEPMGGTTIVGCFLALSRRRPHQLHVLPIVPILIHRDPAKSLSQVGIRLAVNSIRDLPPTEPQQLFPPYQTC